MSGDVTATTVRVLSSVTEIAPQAWNEAVDRLGGSIHHRHEWLNALERGGMVDADAAHVVLLDGPRIVALAPCYLTRRCPKLEMFREYYLSSPFAGEVAAVAHSMYAQTSQVLADSPSGRAAILDVLEGLLWEGRTESLIFPLVPSDDPLLPELVARGYAVGLLSCTNLLPVTWRDFRDYLASRPSAKRRNILRGMRRSEQEGVTATVARGRAGDVGALAVMVRRTAERHGSPLFFDERFLSAVVGEIGDSAVTFTVRSGPTTLLTCLALEHGGVLNPWCVGLEYEGLDRYDHYNFLYASLIDHAIGRHLQLIDFGRSTYVIKRKYGCLQRAVFAAVRTVPARTADARRWVARIDERARDELRTVGIAEPPSSFGREGRPATTSTINRDRG